MSRLHVTSLVLALEVASATAAVAQEVAITPDQIPPTVMTALLDKFPSAKVNKATREREDGTIVYDLEFTQDGRRCEADIREDGRFLNYEKAIPESTLPRAVQVAVAKQAPGARVIEVMEETAVSGTEEHRSAYEVVLRGSAKKEFELRLAPNGKVLEDSRTELKTKP